MMMMMIIITDDDDGALLRPYSCLSPCVDFEFKAYVSVPFIQ